MNEISSTSWRLSRRSFLRVGGATAAGGMLWARWGGEWAEALGVANRDSLTFRLVGDVDLLQLEVRFIRFRRNDETDPQWLEPSGFGDSLVAVRLPAQNLAEAIFDEVHKTPELENDDLDTRSELDKAIADAKAATDANAAAVVKAYLGDSTVEGKNDATAPVRSVLSGPSWLVYCVPDGMHFPLQDVRSWFDNLAQCDLKVPRGALPPERRGLYHPAPPHLDETRLEIPFRLIIAPEPEIRTIFSRFNRKPEPGEFQELWQAALESRNVVKPAPPPPDTPNLPPELLPPRETVLHARAVWSPDYRNPASHHSRSTTLPSSRSRSTRSRGIGWSNRWETETAGSMRSI